MRITLTGNRSASSAENGRIVAVFVFALAIILAASSSTRAQDATPTATPSVDSDTLKKLKDENDILEQKLKKAENQKKLLETYFPKTDQELRKGSIKLENDPYIETEILAYQLMSDSAIAFGRQILGKMPSPHDQNKLFIYSEEQFASPFLYRAYLSQLDFLEQRYQSLPNMTPTPTPAALGPGAAAPGMSPSLIFPLIEGVLGSAADIASFFKTDQVIKGVTFDINELAFVSQIATEPIKNGVKVIYPSVLSPNLFDVASPLMNKVGKLYELRVRAAREIARLAGLKEPIDEDIADLEKQIKAMADGPAKDQLIKEKDDKEKISKSYAERIAPYKTLNQLFEDLVGGLLKPGDNAGITTLVNLLKAEKLQMALDEHSYVVVFKLKTGGNIKITSHIFRSDKQYHSGGSIATYALFDSNMNMVDGSLDPKYRGYLKVRTRTEEGSNLGTGAR